MKKKFLTGKKSWQLFFVALGALFSTYGVFAQDAAEAGGDEQESDADPGYRFLLKEETTTVNSKGLKTTRLHNRIEILKPHAVNSIGDLSIPYNAFRSEARVIKAFTLTPDGRVVEMKKDSVRDLMPDEMSSYQMYTDVHQLSFSMPALSKGAIMDYEVEIEEKKPVMPGEFWVSADLDSSVLVCTSRVAVIFPAKREVKIVATNLSPNAVFKDATNGGLRTLTWEMNNVKALEYEAGMPPYTTVRAQVQLTSVKSWHEVVEWYAGLAKKPLEGDDEIKKLAHKITSGLTNQTDQIQALYRYASHDVRYVGVELGLSDYGPHAPRDTAQNKYGDCKDKAALLVSLLQAIGVKAHLAIVRPNYDGPVDQSLPGPFQFNHAIVYVPRETGDLWIDATQPFCDVTEHGYHLDDIDAMVLGVPGKTLVHISTPDATHSVHRLIFDLDVHYGGLCTVHEIQEYTGRAAVAEREQRSKLDIDKTRKQLEHKFNSDTGYARLLNYSFTSPTNDRVPMRVCVDYDSDTFLTQTKSGYTVRFDGATLRGWLEVPRPDPAAVHKHDRLYPWVARLSHTEEIICRLHLPEGYELTHAPTPTRKELPHGRTEMRFEKSPVPCLTLCIVHHPARLAAADLPDVAQQVDQAIARMRASLDMEDAVNELTREHRFAQAEASVVDAMKKDTNSVDALVRLGSYYKSVGRVYQSQQAFGRAVALAPKSPRGYELLSDTYSGYWGIPGEGFDRKSIMDIYGRALTNVPVRAWTLNKQAEICLIDDCGRGDSTNRLDEADGYFRQLVKDDAQNYTGLFGLGEVARIRGNYDEAEDYYRKAAHAKPNQIEPRAGIWVSMAYAGRDEEAFNAMSACYGSGQQLSAETLRVAQLLTLSRHYAEAAGLYGRLMDSAARPDVLQKLVRLLRKMDKNKRDDYRTCYDVSTPERLGQTLIIANFLDDTNRLFRCLSPAVNREELRLALEQQAAGQKAVTEKMGIDYLLDALLAAFEVSKRTLDNGDIVVKFDASKSVAASFSPASGHVITLQMQRAGDGWQAITAGFQDLDNETLARLSLEALNRGDLTNAISYQTRIADAFGDVRAQRAAAAPFARHLKEIAFTNDALRVKAWAGLSLISSHDRSLVSQGIARLDEVSAAYPEDAWIKMTVAYACEQTANVKRAAAVLETIDVAKLADPDQLAQMAMMLLTLDNPDTAGKVMARLREVAPEDEKLPAIQSRLLALQRKYAEAKAAIEKLRERSKEDNLAWVPAEYFLILATNDKDALHELIDQVREQGKTIGAIRSMIGHACLALGLNDEACEQIATMISEGGLQNESLVGYAQAAIARGDTAEARDLTLRAEQIGGQGDESGPSTELCMMRLALGDYAQAARLYRERGTHIIEDYSGYSLCLSALASKLAGDARAATDTLKEAAAMQGDSDWPRLAIQYVSGDISEDEFRHAPERTTVTPLARGSRECEVNCIVGLLKESKHDISGAMAAYQASLATKSAADTEYFFAKLALQRLQNSRN
jgi:tetratricopeptide (TPR) repeat protein/transglutaminase-like putative cysteine protease